MNYLALSALARERHRDLQCQAQAARHLRMERRGFCLRTWRYVAASAFVRIGSACYKLSLALTDR